MQKQLDAASKQSEEQRKSLSEETTMLRRLIDESGTFPESTVGWTTSEQYEDICDLQTNNIALQDPLKETERALGKVTLSIDCGESLVKRFTQQIQKVQEIVTVFTRSGGILRTRNLPTVRRRDNLSLAL